MRNVPFERGSIFPCWGNLAATNLLGKPLKGFIVNPVNLPRKGVKRLDTSDERVNHGSRVKMYKLCSVLKLVYQPCSRTRAAQKTDGIVAHLMMMIVLMMNIIHVYHHVV